LLIINERILELILHEQTFNDVVFYLFLFIL